MKKTVVIVGAGLEQVRAYKVAKSLGYSTIATDIDKKAPAFEFSDYQLICSTRDPDATLEKLKGLTKKIKIGGVMTIGNDAAQTVALIASHFNLVGISQKAAFGASHKQKMKECFLKNGIRSPQYIVVDSLEELKEASSRLGFPAILKPSDGRGSRGVMYLETLDELEKAFIYARSNSKTKVLIIEKFIEGDQLSVEGIFVKNRFHAVGYADRNYSRLNYTKPFIIEDGGVIPSKYEGEILECTRELIEKASNSLGISEGPVKADIIISEEGPMIIELAARLSGNYLASHHIRWSLGVDLVKAVLKYCMGEKIDIKDLTPKRRKYLAARYFFPSPGYIDAISGIENAKKDKTIKRIELYRKQGDVQPSIEANIHRAGVIRCIGNSLDEVTKNIERARDKIVFSVSNSSSIGKKQ